MRCGATESTVGDPIPPLMILGANLSFQEELMKEAGFTGFEALDIRSPVLSFYAVRH
jgi:hypothetical protein